MEIFKQAGLFYASPLFVGKYEECMDYHLGFNSTLPEKLGLPPLREANQAEGIVIKPLSEINIPAKKGTVRAIVKKKPLNFQRMLAITKRKNGMKNLRKKTELR